MSNEREIEWMKNQLVMARSVVVPMYERIKDRSNGMDFESALWGIQKLIAAINLVVGVKCKNCSVYTTELDHVCVRCKSTFEDAARSCVDMQIERD